MDYLTREDEQILRHVSIELLRLFQNEERVKVFQFELCRLCNSTVLCAWASNKGGCSQ
jgi:hypothetical protein